MKKTEIFLPSKDAVTNLHGYIWEPDGSVCAVLQLVHGMSEYIDRYDAFAAFLTTFGFAVIGHDHLGHGQSVIDEDHLGYFSSKGPDIIISDMYAFTEEAKKHFPGVPNYILGHSMGSFMLRYYLTKHSHDISGAIIMGTGFIPDLLASVGLICSSAVAALKGAFHRSTLLTALTLGSNNKPFMPCRTDFDWLSVNEENVDKYIEDPLCGFMFTAAAYKDFFRVMKYLASGKDFDQIRKDLPVLIVSGELDPVGGKDACPKVKESLEQAGLTRVTMKLYTGDRHEILNENDREQVYNDLLNWMNQNTQ